MSPLLRISLFGCVKIEHDNWLTEAKAPPVAQALLAYLLLKPRLYHPREMLVDIFWSHQDEDKARRCLSTALWRLRRVLEPEGVPKGNYLLTTSPGEIGFNWQSLHWLDVKSFKKGVEQALKKTVTNVTPAEVQKLKAALDLYKGDLLEEFYDDWVLLEREYLRRLYLDGLTWLMRYYKYQGDTQQSLSYGQQILQYDPLCEDIHREIMKLYIDNGQWAKAVYQYQVCQNILDTELNISPMAETQALYRQITASQPNDWQADSVSDMAHFQQVLDQLHQTLDEFALVKKKLHHVTQLVEELRNGHLTQGQFN